MNHVGIPVLIKINNSQEHFDFCKRLPQACPVVGIPVNKTRGLHT